MSWPIDSTTLAELAAIDVAAMPSVCRRGRRTKAVSNGRVTYGTTVSYGSNVACRVSTGQPIEGVEAVGRSGWELAGEIALPLGTDVTVGDWIEATTAPGGNTATQVWEVVGEPVRKTYTTSLRVTTRRVG